MHVIHANNVNDAFQQALVYLEQQGVKRDSRNGPVLVSPEPVTTVYAKPLKRVLFWAERDANPFFHLFEALWMLAGRNDVSSVSRYAKQMVNYSDDGETFHGAYGYRWRKHFNYDQLPIIAAALRKNPDDRRQVLAMWDPREEVDLGRQGKDLPCNTIATFQINTSRALDLSVFNRSNDIVWGCYGANAVHFSFLLEYMAHWIGVPVGTYTQISVNWHGYFETVEPLMGKTSPEDPYAVGEVRPLLLPEAPIEEIDRKIGEILQQTQSQQLYGYKEEFWRTTSVLLYAHEMWRNLSAPERYDRPLFMIRSLDQNIDFVRGCVEWLERRKAKWEAKLHSKSVSHGN